MGEKQQIIYMQTRLIRLASEKWNMSIEKLAEDMSIEPTDLLSQFIVSRTGKLLIAPCENCGNCHHHYEEMDMTADAKW